MEGAGGGPKPYPVKTVDPRSMMPPEEEKVYAEDEEEEEEVAPHAPPQPPAGAKVCVFVCVQSPHAHTHTQTRGGKNVFVGHGVYDDYLCLTHDLTRDS